MDDDSRARWAIRDLREMLEEVLDADETAPTIEIAAAHALHGLDRAEDVLVENEGDDKDVNPFGVEPGEELTAEIDGEEWELWAALHTVGEGELERGAVRDAFDDDRGIDQLLALAVRRGQ